MAAQDLPGTLKAVANIGYEYVEMAGMYGKTPKEVRKLLDAAGLKACSAHCAVFDAAKREQVEEEAKALGYKHLVSGFGPKDFENEESIRAICQKINDAVNHFAPKGYTISIHNHDWEYSAPQKGDLMLELCPKACPQFDIYWVKTGGANPAEVIQRYIRRVKLLHVKDGPATQEKKSPMTAVGKGTVDVAAAIRAAEKGPLEYLIVELDSCETDMLAAVRDSYNFLIGRNLASGRK
jgi:sugar phosphate isomerase/epimerase